MNVHVQTRPTIPPLLALSLLAAPTRASLFPAPGTDPFQPLTPAELGRLRTEHHRVGEAVGRRLGMTTTWARTRWLPGASRGEVVPQFQVTVAAGCPSKATRDLIVDRLGHLGWGGRITACKTELRIEGQRHEATLLLLADGTTITLVVSGSCVRIGPAQVLDLIAGVYHDGRAPVPEAR